MGRCMTELVDKLSEENNLSTLEMTELVRYRNQETTSYIFKKALETKERYYGRKIFYVVQLNLLITVKMNVITVGLEEAISLSQGSGLMKMILWNTAAMVMTKV